MLHHSHWCRHCDTTWADTCLETGYEAGLWHGCWQRKWYATKLAIKLGSDDPSITYPVPNPITQRELNEGWDTFVGRMVVREKARIKRAVDNVPIVSLGKHTAECICLRCRREFADECRTGV